MKTIGIIGYGNLGETLAKYINVSEKLELKKLKLLWICSKHFNDATIFPNAKLFSDISKIKTSPDVIFIASNDNQIENIAATLANIFSSKLFSKIVIHTSGAYGLELLATCEKYGAITVAAHPFQTFFSKEISCLNDIFWGIEINDSKYKADINDLITSLNGHPFFLPPQITNNKALYHSVAVAVSNYVSAAIKLGTLIANEIELPQKDFLIPIIKQTIENCFKSINDNDNNFPLTGPIVRSDTETIEKHIEALNNFPSLQQSYIDFANGVKSIIKKGD
jgi:predicted short-subunit dehydrogenase-like oxidoreductase (DUF2520 family)